MSNRLDRHTTVNTFPGDQVATLRQSLVTICDGHHCAAMLLDFFYEETLVRVYVGLKDEIQIKIDDLLSLLSGLFDADAIYGALEHLEGKGYGAFGRAYYPGYPDVQEYITCLIYIGCVDEAITRIKPQFEIAPQLDSALYTPPVAREIPLELRFRTETARVMHHNHRAEEYGLPATLTIDQWIQTLEHFQWQCAYCGGKYQVLEHFVPLGYEEGTTATNCVPACNKCNGLKGPYHPKTLPSKVKRAFGVSLRTVQAYLTTRREVEEA